MESRLVVDLSSGHLEVTGSEELVKHIFNEFRAEIASRGARLPKADEVRVDDGRPSRETPNKKGGGKRTPATSDVNKDLDTSGIDDFFERYEPKTDAERAMIFIKFLQEDKGMETATIQDVYTCFFAMKSKLNLPNMGSLLRNDSTRTKFFSQQDGAIHLTRIGETHYSQRLRKKTTA